MTKTRALTFVRRSIPVTVRLSLCFEVRQDRVHWIGSLATTNPCPLVGGMDSQRNLQKMTGTVLGEEFSSGVTSVKDYTVTNSLICQYPLHQKCHFSL